MNSSGGELQMFENGLRKYVDSVRWFWRQRDIKSYTFPLSLALKGENWSELKNVAKLFESSVDFSLPIILLRDSQRFILPKLSTEIIKYIIGFVAPEFPNYFEKFLDNLHSVYPVLLSVGRITDNTVQFAKRFHNIGGLIVRASFLSVPRLSQPHVLELLDIGYLFIKLIRSFEGTGTENLIIHGRSLLAALNCIGNFEDYLNQKSISNQDRSFLSHISTFMNGVIDAVNRREKYLGSATC